MESAYGQLSPQEKEIADFFLMNETPQDFSSKAISKKLHVSEASLSRFAQKCGFKGYREFIYLYKNGFDRKDEFDNVAEGSKTILQTYQELLGKAWSLVDEKQISRIAGMISQSPRVFAAGLGSSGFAAREMAFRLMRIGIDIDALSEADLIRMQGLLRKEQDLCIGLSLSGKTEEVIEFLRQARQNGAKTILITCVMNEDLASSFDEVLLVPGLERLNFGSLISPQFPLLVMTDLIYSSLMQTDPEEKSRLIESTAGAIGIY